MRCLLRKYFQLLRGHDRGAVAITFILCLPILMMIIGILVQYALLINARFTLNHAVAVAARSAMTNLPTDPLIEPVDGTGNVRRAAYIALTPLSPAASSTSSEASDVTSALQILGADISNDFAARYSFAQDSAQITIIPDSPLPPNLNFAQANAPQISLSITYDFKLTVPFANVLIGRTATIAGVNGRYLSLTSTLNNVQLSPGREAP